MLTFRPDSGDEEVYAEVMRPNYYLRPLALSPDDIVLDVGAHVGYFTALVAPLVRLVVAVEPDPDNFRLAFHHLTGFANVKLLQGAVVGSSDPTTRLYTTLRNRGNNTTLPKRGRDSLLVQAYNINDLLEQYQPTKVKMDCEGGEYGIVAAVQDWQRVQRMVMEVHYNLLPLRMRNEAIANFQANLQRHFTSVTFPERKKQWHCKYVAVR